MYLKCETPLVDMQDRAQASYSTCRLIMWTSSGT